jgi:hypothetical protein
MRNKWMICVLAALAAGAVQAREAEYECDDGNARSGYRIRVVELSSEIREVIVLKKNNGSAHLVDDQKLRRVGDTSRFALNRRGKRMSFRKTATDNDGNWSGVFTLPGKRGTVQANCGRVETLTL